MRVLALIASARIGGAERAFASLLRGLAREGIETQVVCPAEGELRAEYERWAPFVLPFSRTGASMSLVRKVVDHGRSTRFDVLHTHLWSADLVGAAAGRSLPTTSRVATVQGSYFKPSTEAGLLAAKRRIQHRVHRFVYRGFDRVIAVSAALGGELRSGPGIRVPADRLRVVPNGIDISEVEAEAAGARRESLPVPAGCSLVVVVAHLLPGKGHRVFLAAAALALRSRPDLHFVIVGEGPERPHLETCIRDAGLAAVVHLVGALKSAVRVLAVADLVVLPSLAEGLPLVILEAMALGKPIVSTKVGGVPEVLADSRDSLLVPPGDAGELARAMVRILDDAPLGRNLAARARAEVEQWSASRMVQRTIDVYKEAIAERRVRS